MRHFDYDWDLTPSRILLDNELNTDKLGYKHGDYFKFINVNGQQMLIKVDALEQFIVKGAAKDE